MSCTKTFKIQELPLDMKTNIKLEKLFYTDTCNVSVQFIIFNTKKKVIVKFGGSKPMVSGKSKISLHAEEIAIKYCLNNKLDDRYHIYIWRWSKDGRIKPKYCCQSCCKLATKFNFSNKIFTFDESKKQKAVNNIFTYVSIGNDIRNNI